MKYLDYARLLFLEELAKRDHRFKLRPIGNPTKQKLFLSIKGNSSVWDTGLNSVAFIDVMLNKKHEFMEICYGWHPENISELPELFPRRTRFQKDGSEFIEPIACFDFSDLLERHPSCLPNQGHGTYRFIPKVDIAHQNGDWLSMEQFLDQPNVNDPMFRAKCKEVADLMVFACINIVIPHIEKHVNFLRQTNM